MQEFINLVSRFWLNFWQGWICWVFILIFYLIACRIWILVDKDLIGIRRILLLLSLYLRVFSVQIEAVLWKQRRILSFDRATCLCADSSIVFSGLFKLIYAVFTLSRGIRVIDQRFLFLAKGHDLFVEDFSVVADGTRLIFDWLCHRDLFWATSSSRS